MRDDSCRRRLPVQKLLQELLSTAICLMMMMMMMVMFDDLVLGVAAIVVVVCSSSSSTAGFVVSGLPAAVSRGRHQRVDLLAASSSCSS